MIDTNILAEIVRRAALAANGGSFANDYARQYAERFTVRALAELTKGDLENLIKERET